MFKFTKKSVPWSGHICKVTFPTVVKACISSSLLHQDYKITRAQAEWIVPIAVFTKAVPQLVTVRLLTQLIQYLSGEKEVILNLNFISNRNARVKLPEPKGHVKVYTDQTTELNSQLTCVHTHMYTR